SRTIPVGGNARGERRSRAGARSRPPRATRLRQRDDADAAGLRRAADVVAERDARILHLAAIRFALELLVVLVDHAHTRRARRMAEGLEAAVGVDGELAVEREGAALDVVLGGTLLAEAEVLVGQELGQREAVVNLGDVDLLA